MRTYVETEVFSRAELALFRRATAIVRRLPGKLGAGYVRCHEVARALQRLLGLHKSCVADGWYGMVDHSWLWTTPREPLSPPPNVLDVYAVGRLPPVVLVSSSSWLPFEYRRGDMRKDIDLAVVRKLVNFGKGKDLKNE